MNQPVIRKRRRRISDVENASPTSDLPQQSLVESSPEDKDIEQDFDNNQIRPQTSISSTTINEQSINSIRAELLEDIYHSDLAESNYTNDTHDWGNHGYSHSDEYWHFLGRYE